MLKDAYIIVKKEENEQFRYKINQDGSVNRKLSWKEEVLLKGVIISEQSQLIGLK